MPSMSEDRGDIATLVGRMRLKSKRLWDVVHGYTPWIDASEAQRIAQDYLEALQAIKFMTEVLEDIERQSGPHYAANRARQTLKAMNEGKMAGIPFGNPAGEPWDVEIATDGAR